MRNKEGIEEKSGNYIIKASAYNKRMKEFQTIFGNFFRITGSWEPYQDLNIPYEILKITVLPKGNNIIIPNRIFRELENFSKDEQIKFIFTNDRLISLAEALFFGRIQLRN